MKTRQYCAFVVSGLAMTVLAIATGWTSPGSTPTPAPESNPAPNENAEAGSATFDKKYFESMEWTAIGPPRGGRATACTGVIGDSTTYYMGATGGGVWKTTNAGITWQPLGDDTFKTGSVGSIAVAASDSNVIYVGMGERCPRGNFSHGDGVYKSVDAGKTWENIGLQDSRQIGKILVHPKNPDLAYVAALGHIFGPNDERGIYRTTDGGQVWERILFMDENTGAVDLAMNPKNPREMYAGFWQVKRSPYSLDSGGPGSGLYKTTDGGDTWEELTEGLPTGVMGKIGIAISPVNPDRVWAIIEAEDGGVFRTDDAGETWIRTNEDRSLRQRAWYYTHIYADPQKENTVYVLNVGFFRSDDGGKTFDNRIRVPHGDNHDMWINPDNSMNMIEANDGGANISFDGGKSWTRQDMQPTAQFYHVTVDDQFPYRVYGAQQDNSTISVSSRADQFRMGGNWYAVGGGESGYIAVKPDDPNIIFAGSYDGFLTRYDHSTRTTSNVMVWPENPMGWGAEGMKYRFQWTFPIFFSPHDSNTIYTAGNMLFKSTNEGRTWEAISPDLTTDTAIKQVSSGGPITQDNTSVEYYCTIFAAAESPHEQGVIWTGSDDGLVHITRDGGRNWSNITPPDMPAWGMVSQIDLSPHEKGGAYLAVNRYKMDDFAPYIFKTSDYGKTWKRLDEGIDKSAFVRAVREDPVRRGLLYAGTETGMWISFDDGDNWQSLQLNLPVVPITDLVVKDDELVVATQGRSFWILRDLAPIRQMQENVLASSAHLMAPAITYKAFRETVDVFYVLGDDLEADITLEFLETDGETIRTFKGKKVAANKEDAQKDETSDEDDAEKEDDDEDEADDKTPAKSGMNKFSWNMRYPDAVETKGAVMWGGSIDGPQAPPGEYQVRLSVGDRTQTQSFTILADPRINATQADYDAQFALLSKLRDGLSEAHTAINRIRDVRKQINAVSARAKKIGGMDSIIETAKALNKKLTAIEEELIQTKSKSNQDPLNFPIKLNNKIAALARVISRSNGAPTEASFSVYEDLMSRMRPFLASLKKIMEIDLPAFNQLVRDRDVPAVWVEEETQEED